MANRWRMLELGEKLDESIYLRADADLDSGRLWIWLDDMIDGVRPADRAPVCELVPPILEGEVRREMGAWLEGLAKRVFPRQSREI